MKNCVSWSAQGVEKLFDAYLHRVIHNIAPFVNGVLSCLKASSMLYNIGTREANDFLNKNLVAYKCLSKMKCPCLLNLSTITVTASKPLDLGRPTMKSVLISFYMDVRIGNDYNNPTGS